MYLQNISKEYISCPLCSRHYARCRKYSHKQSTKVKPSSLSYESKPKLITALYYLPKSLPVNKENTLVLFLHLSTYSLVLPKVFSNALWVLMPLEFDIYFTLPRMSLHSHLFPTTHR